MNANDYPASRYDVSPDAVSDENLLAIARKVVVAQSPTQFFPGYDVRPGERVLLVIPHWMDRRVVRALTTAIGEITDEPDLLVGRVPPQAGGGEKGHDFMSIYHYRFEEDGSKTYLLGGAVSKVMGFDEAQIHAFCEAGGYDLLIYGFGGAGNSLSNKSARPYRYEGIVWPTAEFFASGMADYPAGLQAAIDEKAWSMMRDATHARVTDPEGTDISWTIAPDMLSTAQARVGHEVVLRGHLMPLPFAAPLAKDATGVIAATVSQSGAFPRVEVHIVDSRVERIEGGGRFGERWRELLEGAKDVQYPGHPGPGWGWYMECAIGSNPKTVRSSMFTQLGVGATFDRTRSGVLHLGIGAAEVVPGAATDPEVVAEEVRAYREFLGQGTWPDGHQLLHNYFATVELTLPGGKTTLLVDRGRLTALDDPEIRAMARALPGGEALLDEAWIPSIPGINAPGDYEADYATDPLAWIQAEETDLTTRFAAPEPVGAAS